MKVRANAWYIFRRAGWDVFDPKVDLRDGDRVQVKNLHGCPPCNTMGHAHVYDAAGKFRGLVSTASLSKE